MFGKGTNMVKITCSECGASLNIDEKYLWKYGTCKKCGKKILAIPSVPIEGKTSSTAVADFFETPKLKTSAPQLSNTFAMSETIKKVIFGIVLGLIGLMCFVFIFNNDVIKKERVAAKNQIRQPKVNATYVPNNTTSTVQKDILKYSTHKEDIIDAPIKTQVVMEVIVDTKEVTEIKVRELLNFLYNEVSRRTGFKYHKNPTNIFIYAYASKEKASSGMGQWIGMISKSTDDKNPEVTISSIQLNALSEVEENKNGLTQKQRQEIWAKIVKAEDKSQQDANRKYPIDKPGITLDDIGKNIDLKRELEKRLKADIAKEYGIDKTVIDSIGLEGLQKGWAFPK